MKFLLVLFSVLFLFEAKADRLWSLSEVYELGEVIYSSRNDFDHGMSISFLASYEELLDGKGFSYNGVCVVSSSKEVMDVVKSGVERHLSYYPDEDFDFSHALYVLNNALGDFNKIYKCEAANGKHIFKSGLNEFILSYEIF